MDDRTQSNASSSQKTVRRLFPWREIFLMTGVDYAATTLHASLKLKNIATVLKAVTMGRAKLSDWRGLLMFISGVLSMRDTMSTLVGGRNVPIVEKVSFEADASRSCLFLRLQFMQGLHGDALRTLHAAIDTTVRDSMNET